MPANNIQSNTTSSSNKKQAILMGLGASLLFSFTFVLNRVMSLEGGSWIWSSSLRFYWMLPFLLVIVWYKGGLSHLFLVIKKDIGQWLSWSTVGFGLFYAPLTFAASYSPSWLVASTWQVTIVAGMVIAPMINRGQTSKSNGRALIFSGIILLGIIIMQINQFHSLNIKSALTGIVPIIIAAFAYPVGNRKMMQLTDGKLDVFQRVLGMIICSLPFWFILNGWELSVNHAALPSNGQLFQTLIVAIVSGVMATALFFAATDKAHGDEKQLAAVEATQSAEVVFALGGEIFILNSPLPDAYGIAGIILVIAGMVLHSLKS